MKKVRYQYRFIHYFSVLFAVYMVALGLYVDFHPTWYMSLWEKIVIYVSPMLLLLWDMKLHLKHLEDTQEKIRLQRRMLKGIFAIYLIALMTLLFLGSTFRRGFEDRNIWQVEPFSQDHIDYYCNLKVFKSVRMYYHAFVNHTMTMRIIVLNLVGNLIAFVPFGLFVPLIYRKRIHNILQFTILAILCSTAMEFVQFITMVGQADIDDVILNVLGAVIMYLIVYIPPIHRMIHRFLPYGDF